MNGDEKLRRLGVDNILELSLIAPVSYEDNYLSKSPAIGQINVVDARIIKIKEYPKFITIELFAQNFDMILDGVIFHPKAFHRAIFRVGERMFLKGRLRRGARRYELIQPKKITAVNQITPLYKTLLPNASVIALMKEHLKVEALVGLGVPHQEALLLYEIHNPTREFLEEFKKCGGYPKRFLDSLKFAEALAYFMKFAQKREYFPALMRLSGSIEPFLVRLPFELTDDQKRAIDQIQEDLAKDTAARRVIVGDVGCGKTMVILASAMLAFPRRSILMVPTTILANQIYEEAKRFLPPFVKIALVSGTSGSEELEAFHFIIGTHALLYRKLPEAPLVMVDEQHRFGTLQRHLLEKLVSTGQRRPHFLQFSATPIPRTQALIDSALVDITLIRQIPFKKEIKTTLIIREDFGSLLSHIRREVNQGHQVLIIYPIVQQSEALDYRSLEEGKEFWTKHFQNVYVTHGKDKEKESVLEEFRQKGSILLATTVVEVGISLPKLSTIVIVGAERLGLATLHQLRGRVSRTGLRGYCFLYTNDKKNERLKAFAKTTSGFDIAELDLKFRKSGDLLGGSAQSGKSFCWLDMAEDAEIVEKAKRLIEKSKSFDAPRRVATHQ